MTTPQSPRCSQRYGAAPPAQGCLGFGTEVWHPGTLTHPGTLMAGPTRAEPAPGFRGEKSFASSVGGASD